MNWDFDKSKEARELWALAEVIAPDLALERGGLATSF